MTEKDLIYLAGILDFTGAISMSESKSARVIPLIRLSSTSRQKINLIADLGLPVISRDGVHIFQLSHGPAKQLIAEVRPYLRRSGPVAERILRWTPGTPGRKKTDKIPCPKQCGNLMTPGSKTCAECFIKANAKIEPRPRKPTAVVSLTGQGETTQTPTGRIHRMRG
jgi:hypothetical protein